jgi:hypothetical protein
LDKLFDVDMNLSYAAFIFSSLNLPKFPIP